MYKRNKRIFLTLYISYILFFIINAMFFGQYPIFETLYQYLFPLLLVTILLSMVVFLNVLFSSEKLEIDEYKKLLALHGFYFVFAMLLYRLFFY